jgi:outer membrane murein-binding lipoprotein Lpp
MTTRHILMALLVGAVLAAGCGDDEDDSGSVAQASTKPEVVDVAERRAQLEQDPHSVRCSDIRDENSTRNTRMVQHALAADVKIGGMGELAVSQSIYYGLTEVCKGKPGSFEPAADAIAGVKSGRYRAEL